MSAKKSDYAIGLNEVMEPIHQFVKDVVDRFHPEAVHLDVDGELRFAAEAPDGEYTAAQKREIAEQITRFCAVGAVQLALRFDDALPDEEELELLALLEDWPGAEAMNF